MRNLRRKRALYPGDAPMQSISPKPEALRALGADPQLRDALSPTGAQVGFKSPRGPSHPRDEDRPRQSTWADRVRGGAQGKQVTRERSPEHEHNGVESDRTE
ncbi:hypothetical protein MTO96_044791 [Rhipicephalus appendiculatus]